MGKAGYACLSSCIPLLRFLLAAGGAEGIHVGGSGGLLGTGIGAVTGEGGGVSMVFNN